ncbi:DNA cytosine methyltransferase [Nocardia farcinica]|uniref:DNA cytosine methyltransferase n=1 Tax=Nocardia farcinica TaxID=37329 RepID=UPI001B3C7136|nr:DNA cytosine methyltransferase [Nocardia farcinica]MBF6540778.1 DNA cytosine methyltransferase [Nocardia farcinica]
MTAEGPTRVGSLFSGAGGLDLAALDLFPDASMAWHAEVDDAASNVLAYRWPGVPNLGDVTKVDWSTVEPVDVLCGGFPCQDVSLAGRRAGLGEGTRSGLWSYMFDAITRLRPRFVLIENVRGLLSAKAIRGVESGDGVVGEGGGGSLRALGAVLGDLSSIGFDADWTLVRASDVGACHQRARVFVLAYPADTDLTRHELLAGCSVEPSSGVTRLLPTPQVADVTGGHKTRSGARANELLLPGVAEAHAQGRLLPTPNASDGSGGGQHPDRRGGHSQQLTDYALLADSERWGVYAAAISRQERLSRPAPPPTEVNKNGRPRLSAAFAEWMMWWPAGWVTDPNIGLSRNEQLKICGNGVVPRQAVVAFRSLFEVAASGRAA